MLNIRHAAFAAFLAAAIGCNSAAQSPTATAGRATSPMPPRDVPMGPSAETSRLLMPQRLTGARLDSIAGDGEWTFTDKRFVLKAGAKPIPGDLLKAILGPDHATSRIEGNWRLDDGNRVLVLSDLKADGKGDFRDARLSIEPAGPRVNIAGPHQYNIVERGGQ